MLIAALAWLATVCVQVAAISVDQVGKTDLHVPLLGPVRQSWFHKPAGDDAGTVCLALSSRNVLAGLRCGSGDILWRQWLQRDGEHATKAVGKVLPFGDRIATIWSAGETLSVWQVERGRSAWDVPAPKRSAWQDFATTSEGDVVAVAANGIVKKLGPAGETKWTYQSAAKDAWRVAVTEKGVYVLGLDGRVVVEHIDPLSGASKELIDIPQRPGSATDVLAFDHGLFVFKAGDKLFYNVFGTSAVSPLEAKKTYDSVHITTASDTTGQVVLAQFTQGKSRWATVYRISAKPSGKATSYEIPALSIPAAFALAQASDATFVVRTSRDAGSAEIDVWAGDSHAKVSSQRIATKDIRVAQIVDLAAEVDADRSARVMLSTEQDQFALLQDDAVAWSTEQGIANAEQLLFVQLPEIAALEASHDPPTGNLVHDFTSRTRRHTRKLIKLFVELSPRGFEKAIVAESDRFGLRQYIVAVGPYGQLWALDNSRNGKLVWASEPVAKAKHVAAWIPKSPPADLGIVGVPTICTLLNVEHGSQLVYTNALTGASLRMDQIAGHSDKAVFIDDGSAEAVGRVQGDRFDFLTSNGNETAVVQAAQNLVLVEEGVKSVEGRIVNNGKLDTLWRVDLPGSLVATAFARPEEIASVGRVLGDRGVLYKYLSRSLMAAASITEDQRLVLQLIDTADGSIMHTATHAHVGADKPVRLVVSENWLAYHYWVEGQVKGYQMTISELYHGGRNEKSGSQRGTGKLNVISRSFLYDRPVRALGATTTAQGITTRDVLVATADQVAVVPRRMLDPRRPATLSASDKEEFLIPYEPVLPDDPKLVLSHAYTVLGADKFTVTPTLLESTALVAVHGLDIFSTRVTPSMAFDLLSTSFSKSQIVISILLLAAATVVVRPIVARKKLQRAWVA